MGWCLSGGERQLRLVAGGGTGAVVFFAALSFFSYYWFFAKMRLFIYFWLYFW
jgi:hypothetical protein